MKTLPQLIENIKLRLPMGKVFILIFGVLILVLVLLLKSNNYSGPSIPSLLENNYVAVSDGLDSSNAGEFEDNPVPNQNSSEKNEVIQGSSSQENLYLITKVVDGDTIEVIIAGQTERVRLIGINTPETVDPRRPLECFGTEASNYAKTILTGKRVSLVADVSQTNRDKYDRLLRYVFLPDGTNFNLMMIRDGYAYEYTYDLPYKYQTSFRQAEQEARAEGLGLWAQGCDSATNTNHQLVPTELVATSISEVETCMVKGNINSDGEKIYRVPGCDYYVKTKISPEKGERWFCSEADARKAGWRKALNCQ